MTLVYILKMMIEVMSETCLRVIDRFYGSKVLHASRHDKSTKYNEQQTRVNHQSKVKKPSTSTILAFCQLSKCVTTVWMCVYKFSQRNNRSITTLKPNSDCLQNRNSQYNRNNSSEMNQSWEAGPQVHYKDSLTETVHKFIVYYKRFKYNRC